MLNVLVIMLLTTFAFVIAFLWAPILTNFLFRHKLGKQIRSSEETPIFFQYHAKKSGTPTMGGILIWGTVFILVILFYCAHKFFPDSILSEFDFFSRSETLLPLGALLASAVVGLIDDIFNVKKLGASSGGLRVRHRLLIYSAIALVGAFWFVAKLDWTTIRIPFIGFFDIGPWYILVSVFIIVSTSFSVNETDGLDGLAGGVLLTAFGALAVIAFIQGKYDLAALCGVIIGALLSFLWFNIPPARFFMGDTGAMSLGVTLGIVAMLTHTIFLLPIIGFVLVLESLSVLLQLGSRKLFKRKLFISSPLHHHFEALGWSEAKIVMRFWIIAGVASVIGLVIAIVDFSQQYG